ncbi:hypothetical protein TSTA_017240 [Talaromyces stipitatus ATCC 10500]|uniref:Uncharacterized protein n=1 Tax=Talaromyces stipitatus (strain ATCC 10500 / CBS 375.48 / QM 6759 / NRRL 1006) TaxID=441959 RepID=B8MFB5_TALSN|nr:uncharacterized protein TSTA_017240 [Talaromyces stipitatus ATCC 10500]EED16649.1 hypothetical protein TSTA_017240 [Talaromyces stipitatus ATCC 10500]
MKDVRHPPAGSISGCYLGRLWIAFGELRWPNHDFFDPDIPAVCKSAYPKNMMIQGEAQDSGLPLTRLNAPGNTMARKGSGTDGPLQTALLESTFAATTRASEGQKIFSPIAAFLDKHRSQTAGLAPHLLRALTALSDDLASIAHTFQRLH